MPRESKKGHITMDIQNNGMTRRVWLQRAGALGLLAAMERLVPSYVWASASKGAAQTSQLNGNVVDLTIAETPFRLDGRTAPAITINGTIPGPVIRLKEGQQATLRVTNRLQEVTVDSLARVACAARDGRRAWRQLRRHQAGHHLYVSVPGAPERHLLVS